MTAIQQAYASNTETPILTLDIDLASSGTNIKLYRGYGGMLNTLQGAYQPAAIEIKLPDKNTDGNSALSFSVTNVDLSIMASIYAEVDHMRGGSSTPTKCTFRRYLPSVLAATPNSPYGTFSGEVYVLNIESVSANAIAATFSAKYAPLPDVSFPRHRYFTDAYPGLKYANR